MIDRLILMILKKETNLIEIIEGFLSDKQQKNFVLRIGFESLGYEFQAREILANAIGKYLLKLARNQNLKRILLYLF